MFNNNFYNKIKNLLPLKKIKISKNILDTNINDKFKVIRTHKNNTAIIFFTQKNFPKCSFMSHPPKQNNNSKV